MYRYTEIYIQRRYETRTQILCSFRPHLRRGFGGTEDENSFMTFPLYFLLSLSFCLLILSMHVPVIHTHSFDLLSLYIKYPYKMFPILPVYSISSHLLIIKVSITFSILFFIFRKNQIRNLRARCVSLSLLTLKDKVQIFS